ncbi:protein kinase domain-containing protein [Allorhizocola rhizosphaerae]|uniref:protein kinase domain-containing protein n=1 Tax=Allorhizocola rhizosphaerae TaxID=1872709 RepID=UPI000E3BEF32|nr:serine/threonine-protein kinase [Allorhizocola rhizosphaerae]
MASPSQIGSYRVERLLGTGSFATVWLGFDPALGARVAIKVLADNWNHDLRVRERFVEEARLLWRLDHERIVRVHLLGELPDGRPYIVMAWADGGSLRERLAAGPLAIDAGLRLLQETAAGVAFLHSHGIVHRDLSPGNVLFVSRGPVEQVMIADLGLAKELAVASGLTARAGTPGFMAPEQDDPLAVVDERTDVFGLGRLGVLLLGVDFGRTGGRVVLRDGVPASVGEVLRIATAQRAADRYRDAAAFGAALRHATAERVQVPHMGRRVAFSAALVLAAAGLLAADGPSDPPGTASDPLGRLVVALPQGWRAGGGRWKGQFGPDGRPEPALVIAPDPSRWTSHEAMPGAFVGLSRTIAARTTPAGFLAERAHAGCLAGAVRTARLGAIVWVIAPYTACVTGKTVIVEAASLGPGGAGLIYLQIAPPIGSGDGFIDALLAGVRVR